MEKLYTYPILFLLCISLTSCKTPFDPTDVRGGEEISIHYLKTLYKNQPLRIADDYLVTGTVVSSDRQGNFRWTLVVEDETGGIELKIGLSPYFERFPVGRQIRIACAGLTLGAYGRTIQLGADSGNEQYETGFIDAEKISQYITPTGDTKTILPATLTPAQIAMRYVNCAIRLESVRFIDEEQGLTWGDGEHYVERHLVFPDSPGDTLPVRTAPTAVFGDEALPTGTGGLEGILTQFAGNYSLVLLETPKVWE